MFSDKDLERLIDYRRENPGSLPLGWQGMFDNLIARLKVAEDLMGIPIGSTTWNERYIRWRIAAGKEKAGD